MIGLRLRKAFLLAGASVVFLWAGASFSLSAAPQMDHEHMDHVMPSGAAAPDPAKIAADKRFSEFNHRFAGLFVLLIGLLCVLEPRLAERFGGVRYLWSVLFFLPGLYLLIWSDPESWPTGNQSLHYVITQNLEVLQHKVFSLLLLGLGAIEFVRVKKGLRSAWLSLVFPVLAGAGALLLLFHVHSGPMDAAAHATMLKIEHQHLGFAITGFGIAVSKAFADVGKFHPRLMRNLFAVLMVVLGCLLLAYTE
jgi:putative copper resistance protein D